MRAGTLALGGLTLPWLLRARADAAEGSGGFVRDKAVILVFLAGGASHIETFNPNMDAPDPFRSITGAVDTALPGVQFGGTFPLLAERADRMAVVRSFRHGVGDHDGAIVHVLSGGTDPTGKRQQGQSLGSLYARLRGANHPRTGLPTYALLLDRHKDSQYAREMNRVANGSWPGEFGPMFAPFEPDGGQAKANMQLRVAPERLDDRRELLGQLDALRRDFDDRAAAQSPDQFTGQAMQLLLGGAAQAFDLKKESPRLVERYDTRQFRCGKKTFEPSILGQQMLLARRLVEAGAGFVTVQSAGWDMHADGNNPPVKEGMEMLGRPLDKALSALLDDLHERGLSDKVLVVVTGDFGRTPKVNARGGRDHWAPLGTLAFAGGGLRMGQVIGQSDRQNGAPQTDPISTPNLLATVMHTLFDVGQLRIAREVPANLLRIATQPEPIAELFS